MQKSLKFIGVSVLSVAYTYADGPRHGRWQIMATTEMVGMAPHMPAQKITLYIRNQ